MSETRFEAELNRRISLVVRGFVILGLLMLVSVQNWTTTSRRSGDARVL